MKTRIFHTKFYKDHTMLGVDLYAQHLLMYLKTNEHINMTGMYQLPDPFIMLEAKLTPSQLDKAKETLTRIRQALFKDGWVYVLTASQESKYHNSAKNLEVYNRELASVPQDVMEYFNSTIDSTMPSTRHSNDKSKIRNKKQEGGTGETKTLFEEFWQLYPRKQDRQKAKVLYEKLVSQGLHEQVILGLKRYLAYWRSQKTELKYIKLPSAWLNARRWEDELEAGPNHHPVRKPDLPPDWDKEPAKPVDPKVLAESRKRFEELKRKKLFIKKL